MKLLIIDDHPVMREGLAALLRQVEPGAEILLAGESGQGLNIAEAHPDLDGVILDLSMPGIGGIETIQEFGRRRPQLPVIVLSSSEDPRDVRRAMAAGALGYVPKSAPPQTLLSALHFVLAGNLYVPTLLLSETGAATTQTRTNAGSRLTERQIEVLTLVCEGLPNKEIGFRLGLSEKTVKAHVTSIFKTLNVVNRTQAIAVAKDLGFF
ncbi:response regulator [Methylocystis heyeri]|uniref:Response regulator n=1 Tax=Methylocystis heyeri TaxID=391905 RepID=A0A6B8KAY5_9HYPH|nr:response regulator transcription factor [Methylocystis heyeri]QGM44265.1 response regulator [Methylocystis heyeri]